MKKYTVLFVMFTLLAAVLSAAADSVWMPMDDYFMDTWDPESDQTCESQSRPYYVAAGENGWVTAVKTPLNHAPVSTYPNGTHFKIAFVCGSGENLWGAVEAVRLNGEVGFTEKWEGTSGYIAFSDLVRAYDAEAFIADHQIEIHTFAENGYNMCSGNEFVLWTAPNSGVQVEYVTSDYISFLCMDYDPNAKYKMFTYGGFYIDPDGNRWVEVTLRRETEHGWFCLDRMTDGGAAPQY